MSSPMRTTAMLTLSAATILSARADLSAACSVPVSVCADNYDNCNGGFSEWIGNALCQSYCGTNWSGHITNLEWCGYSALGPCSWNEIRQEFDLVCNS